MCLRCGSYTHKRWCKLARACRPDLGSKVALTRIERGLHPSALHRHVPVVVRRAFDGPADVSAGAVVV
eukprot:854847-Amphidinium_carterae.1